VWNGTNEDSAEVMKHFYVSEEYQSIQPIATALPTLQALSDKFRFIVITSRSDAQRDTTLQFLHTNFPNMFEQVVFTNTFASAYAHKKCTKAFMMKQLNAQVLIDDSINNIVQCAQENVKGILFGHYPWNMNRTLTSQFAGGEADAANKIVKHVQHWHQIEQALQQLLEQQQE